MLEKRRYYFSLAFLRFMLCVTISLITLCGASIESKAAGITIIQQPEDTVVQLDEYVRFTVVAEGEGLSYQWYYSSDNGRNWYVSSVTTSTYGTYARSNRDGCLYRCVISDNFGEQIISNSARLIIGNPLSIITQPLSVEVEESCIAEFTVAAEGDGLSYLWQYSRDSGSTWIDTSAKGSKYSVMATALTNGWMYRCVITDKYGFEEITDEVTLTATAPPSIVTKRAFGDGWHFAGSTFLGEPHTVIRQLIDYDVDSSYFETYEEYTDFSYSAGTYCTPYYAVWDIAGTYVYEFDGYSVSYVSSYDGYNTDIQINNFDATLYLEVDGNRYIISPKGRTTISFEHPYDTSPNVRLYMEYDVDGYVHFDDVYIESTGGYSRSLSAVVRPEITLDNVYYSGYMVDSGSEYPLEVQTVDWLSKIKDAINNLNIAQSNDSNSNTSILENQTTIQKEQNQLQQDTNILQEESNALQQEQNTMTGTLVEESTNFFGNFFGNLVDSITGLFIPEEGYFSDFFQRMNDFFSEKLGVLYAPIDIFIDILNGIASTDGTDPGIPFPGIQWEGVYIIEPQTISLTAYAKQLPGLQDKIYFVTDLLMVGWVIWLLQIKLKEVMNN